MKQEESYLSYEDFRKNATNETVEAFLTPELVSQAFTSFDENLHREKIEEYLNAQFAEITEKTKKLIEKFNVVTTANSPIALMINGVLKYSVMIIISEKQLTEEQSTDENEFTKLIMSGDVIAACPEDFRDEDGNVAFMHEGIKTTVDQIQKAIFNLGSVGDSRNDTLMHPFTDEYIDYMCRISVGLALATGSHKDPEQLKGMEEIETKVLHTKQYRDEDQIKEMIRNVK